MTVVLIEKARNVDIVDIVRRSSVANQPQAIQIMRDYLRRSVEAWTGTIDGQVACVWGLVAPSIISDEAYLWLLTTDVVDQHQFIFVRHSQIVVEKMLERYPIIRGTVVEGELRSIRWLKWLGMKLGRHHDGLIDFELRSA
jgi:hypothetical protein